MSNNPFPNRDPETGIRYGVVPANDLYNCGEEFYDHAEDLSYKHYIQEAREKLLRACEGVLCDDYGVGKAESDRAAELAFELAFDDVEDLLNDRYECDCPHLEYVKDGYVITKLDETDLFVAKSPYFCFAPECSPCAPGACYLRDAMTVGSAIQRVAAYALWLGTGGKKYHKSYCLGADWYDESEQPKYSIYEVATGKIATFDKIEDSSLTP